MQNIFFQKFTDFENETFLKTNVEALTFSETIHKVDSLANHYIKLGFNKGDRIAILSENSSAFTFNFLALWRIGAIAVPINTRWPEQQISSNLNKLEIKSILYSNKYKAIAEILKLGITAHKMAISNESEIPQKITDENEDATIIFTSGSTSKPKAALHTFNNHFYNALGSN